MLRLVKFAALALPLTLFSVAASAEEIPVGYVSYDVTTPGSSAQFDITNETGPNSSPFPDPSFPITTSVNLSSLSLTVDFSNGSTVTEGSSYFTLNADGLSYSGNPIGIGGTNPQPTSATLTGSFSPTTITLNDGSTETIESTFSASISPSSPPDLADGDLAVIYATTTALTTPEPGSWLLLGTLIACLGISQRMRVREILRRVPGLTRTALPMVLAIGCLQLIPQARALGATVNLSGTTSPGSGVAGVNNVNVTVNSGWPSADTTAANITVTWATTCGGATAAIDSANSVKKIIGTSERVNVNIPASLATGTYFVQVLDSSAGDVDFTSSNCSEVQITGSSKGLAACVPASSLGVIAPVSGPAPVTAILPNGAWDSSSTGIEVVQVETGGGPVVPPVAITTTDGVNSCAGNPATGEAVCVANDTNVYHISATNAVTTLTSGASAFTGFSGGECENCGVAVNALNNFAVITVGSSTSPSRSGLQVLNLSNNTFGPVFNTAHEVSENIAIDPNRGVVLSADEADIYDLISIDSAGTLTTEYAMPVSIPGELDSSTEDCATGIALAPSEFTNDFVLADLTQATFTPGTPGSWTAPHSVTSIIGSYSAGLSGSAVAPGGNHVAVVTGEFGGSSFSILQLPATSGTGTPALVDYAYVPCVIGMSAGLDPHTVTAYVSPNDGKSYTLFANHDFFPPNLLRADMTAILALPREGDGHTVIPDTSGCLDPAGPIGSTVLENIASH